MAYQRNGGIVWTNQTWNPLRGCSRVSLGCMNCYAEAQAARFCGAGQPYEDTINPETKRWNGTIKLVHDKLTEPLRWKRPRMVFVNSMSDLFHEDVPDEYIDKVFAVMALAKQHTFQVLTKRPERMLEYLKSLGRHHEVDRVSLEAKKINTETGFHYTMTSNGWALPNVWIGVTIENQEAADERIPLLLQTPAAVRWISVEPLLGPVNLERPLPGPDLQQGGGASICQPWMIQGGIDWVVVGGESGHNARPMHTDWARSLRDQCAAAGVPFLFKQHGEWRGGGKGWHLSKPVTGGVQFHKWEDGSISIREGKKSAGRLLDGVQHDGYPEAMK